MAPMTAHMTTMVTVTNDLTINHYGQMAWDHWRRHRSEDLAAIEDPTRFFHELGEEVAETVRDRTELLLASQPQASGFAARVAREQTARRTVEDETLRMMVFTEPSGPTTDDTTSDTSNEPTSDTTLA